MTPIVSGTGPATGYTPPTDSDRLDLVADLLRQVLAELREQRSAKASAVPAIPASNAGLDEIHAALVDMANRLDAGLQTVNGHFEAQRAQVHAVRAVSVQRRADVATLREQALGGAARVAP